MSDDTTTLPLKVPIDGAAGAIKEIRIRRPVVRDHLLSSRGATSAVERDVALVRIVSGLTEEQVRDMDLGDLLRAQDIVVNFLAAGSAKPKS